MEAENITRALFGISQYLDRRRRARYRNLFHFGAKTPEILNGLIRSATQLGFTGTVCEKFRQALHLPELPIFAEGKESAANIRQLGMRFEAVASNLKSWNRNRGHLPVLHLETELNSTAARLASYAEGIRKATPDHQLQPC